MPIPINLDSYHASHNVIFTYYDKDIIFYIIYQYATVNVKKYEFSYYLCSIITKSLKMKGTKIKQENIELLLDINVGSLARKYFNKSGSWLYHKLDGKDGNGKETDFSPEELELLKGAFYDLADRLRKAADNL